MVTSLKGIKEALIPATLIVIIPTTVLGFILSGSKNIMFLLTAIMLVVLVDISANVINNYSDWEIDIRNHKRKTLHRSLKRRHLLWMYTCILLGALAILILSNSNRYLWIVAGLFVLLGFSYSLSVKLKDMPIANYATIAIAYGGLSTAVGFFSGSSSLHEFIKWSPLVIFIVLAYFGYSMTKDYSDVVGDKQYNKKTFPVLLGKKNSIKLQVIVITAAYVYLLLLVALKLLSPSFLVLLVSYAIAIYILFVVYSTKDKQVHLKMHRYSQVNGLLISMLIIAVLLLH